MSAWSGSGTSNFWVGAQPIPSHKITTSRTEILHATIAFLVLTLDIALVESQLTGRALFGGFTLSGLLGGLAFGASAALTGFLLHEMAHKVTAERRGFWAEFRMSPVGLLLSFVTALIGFLFAAPGATVVGGMGSKEDWGVTSLAGPALNLTEGTVFGVAGLAVLTATPYLGAATFLILLAFINGWFATFNLLPFGPLDGAKVLRWSKPIWATTFALGAFLSLVMFSVISFGWPLSLGGL
jgi:Zn-dependent protease